MCLQGPLFVANKIVELSVIDTVELVLRWIIVRCTNIKCCASLITKLITVVGDVVGTDQGARKHQGVFSSNVWHFW